MGWVGDWNEETLWNPRHQLLLFPLSECRRGYSRGGSSSNKPPFEEGESTSKHFHSPPPRSYYPYSTAMTTADIDRPQPSVPSPPSSPARCTFTMLLEASCWVLLLGCCYVLCKSAVIEDERGLRIRAETSIPIVLHTPSPTRCRGSC